MPHTIPWEEVRSTGVASLPAPLPEFLWQELYDAFSTLAALVSSEPHYAQVLEEEAKKWQAETRPSLLFSGYFSPYYRDRTGQEGRDNKRVIQFCAPYYRYLCEHQPRLLRIPEFRGLIDGLMAVLSSLYDTYLPSIAALHALDPRLAEALLPTNAMAPVALRLIRYQTDARYFTNPHVDKSAVTIMLHTDEPPAQPCLVFAPRDVPTPRLSEFAPAERQEGESLVFMGAAPREARYLGFPPASHAVRPLDKVAVRHVALFFWLLPGVDMASFDTSTSFVDDLDRARANRPKVR